MLPLLPHRSVQRARGWPALILLIGDCSLQFLDGLLEVGGICGFGWRQMWSPGWRLEDLQRAKVCLQCSYLRLPLFFGLHSLGFGVGSWHAFGLRPSLLTVCGWRLSERGCARRKGDFGCVCCCEEGLDARARLGHDC